MKRPVPRPISKRPFALPKWHLGQWHLRVGYKLAKDGVWRRVPRSFYWSFPNTEAGFELACAKAAAVQNEWQEVCAVRWPQIQAELAQFVAGINEHQLVPKGLPPISLARPVWPDHKKVHDLLATKAEVDASQREITTRTFKAMGSLLEAIRIGEAPEVIRRRVETADVPGELADEFLECGSAAAELQTERFLTASQMMDSAPWILDRYLAERQRGDRAKLSQDSAPPSISINDAIDRYIDDAEKRLELQGARGHKLSSFNTLRNFILCSVGRSTAAGGPKKGKSPLTRVVIDTSRQLQTISKADCRQLVDFWCSRRTGVSSRTARNYCTQFYAFLKWAADREEFGFTLPSGLDAIFKFQSTLPTIERYDPAVLKAILKAADRRTQLYILLFLNCGYYPAEVAALQPSSLVQRDGDWYLRHMRTKEERRSRYVAEHYLWPETVQRLKAEMAPEGNPHNRLLLAKDGTVLHRVIKRGSRISLPESDYYRACEHAGQHLQLKQLRKIGSTEIQRLAEPTIRYNIEHIVRLYRGASIQGSSRFYVIDDFAPLTNALKRLADKLRQDGVLY